MRYDAGLVLTKDLIFKKLYELLFITGLPLLGKPSLKFGRSSVQEVIFPWDVCYVVQFQWFHRDLFEMWNLYGVLSLASTGNDVILRHRTCFRPFHELRGYLVKEDQYV